MVSVPTGFAIVPVLTVGVLTAAVPCSTVDAMVAGRVAGGLRIQHPLQICWSRAAVLQGVVDGRWCTSGSLREVASAAV